MKILYNATIYTLASDMPRASALLIDHGKIVARGSMEDFDSASIPTSDRINLEGKVVIPGLTDAHIHLEHYALSLQKVDCETNSRQECLGNVARRVKETPPGEWILGHGWNQNNWPEGFGSAGDLDQIAPNNPVYLTAKSLHAGWANTAALKLAGITADSADPAGGRIDRDRQGIPTGIFLENAMNLISQAIPKPSSTHLYRAMMQAIGSLHAMGLTGVHDFDRRDCFLTLQQIQADGGLSLRVLKSLPLDALDHAIGLGLRTGFGNDNLRIGSIKCFADGALGPQTAAMFEPYQGTPENRGMLLLDEEELFEYGRSAADSGLSLAVHAIGDLANHQVLNAFSSLRAYERDAQLPALRHRIEHVQIIHPDDAGRLAELGVIASMQPIHATSDMKMADRYWGARSANAYAWRTQLDQNAVLAFGSDAPVESPNPFWGLHAAVTRQRADGFPDEKGWYAKQRLSLLEALHAYTQGAAYAAGTEDRIGKLSPGYYADLLVLDTDPFQCPPPELRQIRPAATMVGGQWVYQA